MHKGGLWRNVLLVIVLALGACSVPGGGGPLTRSPRLVAPGAAGNAIALGIPQVEPGSTLVLRGVVLCLSEPGSVSVVRVDVAGDGPDVEVSDFALRDNPGWAEGSTAGRVPSGTDERGDLEDAGFEVGATTADLVCDPQSGRGHEIGIEVVAPPPGEVGIVPGFEVTWSGPHGGGTTAVPFGVVLCPDRTAAVPRCSLDLLPNTD